MQAPSAHNFQPWEFVVVKNKDNKDKISRMSPYGTPARNADVLIIPMVNLKKVEKEDLWWQQDLSACTQNILLQSVEEGLEAVWLGFYPVEERISQLKELLNLPSHIVPFSVVAIGYPNINNNEVKDKFNRNNIYIEQYEER